MSRFKEEIAKMKAKRIKTAEQIALFIEAEAKMRAPVDTGHLRRSISHEVNNTEDQSKIYVGTNVEYAPYVEFGVESKNIKAQPYLRPAIDENIEKIKEMIKKGMSVE